MPRPFRLWTLGSLALLSLVRPQTAVLALNDRPEGSLLRWDRESTPERPIPGFFGVDAHGASPHWGRLGPGYLDVFSAASTHVVLPRPLTGDASRDSALILSALRSGHSYFAWDLLGNPAGFQFRARSDDGRSSIAAGEAAQVTGGWRLEASLSRPAEGDVLRLYRDGTLVATGQDSLTWPLQRTGVYRVEVWLEPAEGEGVPWIYSNMIGVRMSPPTGTVTTSGDTR